MSWIAKQLDKLKAGLAIKFIAPYIKTIAPYLITWLVALGVDPALAERFANDGTLVLVAVVTFAIDFFLTSVRKKV